MSENSTPNRVPPWRRRRRKLLAALSMLFAALILLAGGFRWHSQQEVAQELAAIRAAGFPATPEELNGWYPEPPPEQNAAEIYAQSFAAQRESNTGLKYDDISKELKEAQNVVSEALLQEMEAYLAENAEVLRLMHEAAKYPAARYPVDFSQGYNMDLSHLARLRQGVRLVNLEALVAAARGHPGQALDSIMTALAAIDSLREEPIVISQLVGIATRNNTCDTLRRLLEMGTFSEAQLAQLSPALQRAHDPEGLSRALAGERVCGLSGYSQPRQLFEQFANLDNYVPGANTIVSGLANLTGALNGDREFYLDAMDGMISASQEPYYQARPALEDLAHAIDANHSWIPRFSEGLLPALTRMHSTYARGQADIENTVTAIAIERYRNVTGHVPARIEDLAPSFLDSVPLDPFDGQPLRYKPDGNGYCLYSIGENLRDDGAVELAPDQSIFREVDWFFRVRRN